MSKVEAKESYMQGVVRQLSKPLTIEDVDFRIQSINYLGRAVVLGYKDARVDMRRLDAATGGMWQRKHSRENANCTIEIWDYDTNQWVGKEDTGTASMTEAQKGMASDSFKRSGFNWGIGRDLYDLPFISIQLQVGEECKKNDRNKMQQAWGLKLNEWKWTAEYSDEGSIIMLAARDYNNRPRYYWTVQDGVKIDSLKK